MIWPEDRYESLKMYCNIVLDLETRVKGTLLRFNCDKMAVIWGELVNQLSRALDSLLKMVYKWELGGRNYLCGIRTALGSYLELMHYARLIIPSDHVMHKLQWFQPELVNLLRREAVHQSELRPILRERARRERMSWSEPSFNEKECIDLIDGGLVIAGVDVYDDLLYERILSFARRMILRCARIIEAMDERALFVHMSGFYQTVQNSAGIGAHFSEGKGKFGYSEALKFTSLSVACCAHLLSIFDRRFGLPAAFYDSLDQNDERRELAWIHGELARRRELLQLQRKKP